jgi:hypothetical protein
MKKTVGCLLLCCNILAVSGQQIYIETGKILSSFHYKDSNGDQIKDLKGTLQNSFGVGIRMPVLRTACNVSMGLASNKYGASESDQTLGNYSEWEASYLGFNLSVGYEFLRPPMHDIDRNGFSFFVNGGTAAELLVSGKQRLNSQVYDLKGQEEFDRPLFFVKGSGGVNYYITRRYLAFAEYTFGRSILIGNYSGQERLHYVTHCISLGFSVDLAYKGK